MASYLSVTLASVLIGFVCTVIGRPEDYVFSTDT
jgi:hypothetical protein